MAATVAETGGGGGGVVSYNVPCEKGSIRHKRDVEPEKGGGRRRKLEKPGSYSYGPGLLQDKGVRVL